MGSIQSCSFYEDDKIMAIVISRLSLPRNYTLDPIKSTKAIACYVHKYDHGKPDIWCGRRYHSFDKNTYQKYSYQETVNAIKNTNKYKNCNYSLDDYTQWKNKQDSNISIRRELYLKI